VPLVPLVPLLPPLPLEPLLPPLPLPELPPVLFEPEAPLLPPVVALPEPPPVPADESSSELPPHPDAWSNAKSALDPNINVRIRLMSAPRALQGIREQIRQPARRAVELAHTRARAPTSPHILTDCLPANVRVSQRAHA